jgi:hypothetical protein
MSTPIDANAHDAPATAETPYAMLGGDAGVRPLVDPV